MFEIPKYLKFLKVCGPIVGTSKYMGHFDRFLDSGIGTSN